MKHAIKNTLQYDFQGFFLYKQKKNTVNDTYCEQERPSRETGHRKRENGYGENGVLME